MLQLGSSHQQFIIFYRDVDENRGDAGTQLMYQDCWLPVVL